MRDETRVVVAVEGIIKRYAGVLALNQATLDLRKGEVLGLVGQNGAGKSTLIKVLAGSEAPDGGRVLIDGAPPPAGYAPHVAHRLGLAFVHQEIGNFPGLTVAENVALGERYPRRLGLLVAKGELRERVASVLQELEADIEPGADVAELTTVQQRVVMVARALYHRARLLVLDEPSTALTANETDHLHAVVRQMRRRGASVVYVSHRLDEILALTDRIAVMRDGRVVLERSTSDLARPELIEAIAGRPVNRARGMGRRGRGCSSPVTPVVSVERLARPPRVVDVSFDVRPGEVLGLAGLVGAGRTETARMIFGADQPTAGTILLEGRERSFSSPADAIRAGVALLPEDRRHEGLVLDFGVRANVTLASLGEHCMGVSPFPSRASETAITRQMVSRLAIQTPTIEQPVRRLSGGNQQKVVVAKWLARRGGFKLIIFDEPTQGVDVGGKEEILGLIQGAADASEGRAVIFISSEFEELTRVCTRIVALREGRVAGSVEGEQITEEALVALAYGQHNLNTEEVIRGVR